MGQWDRDFVGWPPPAATLCKRNEPNNVQIWWCIQSQHLSVFNATNIEWTLMPFYRLIDRHRRHSKEEEKKKRKRNSTDLMYEHIFIVSNDYNWGESFFLPRHSRHCIGGMEAISNLHLWIEWRRFSTAPTSRYTIREEEEDRKKKTHRHEKKS